VFFVLSKDKNTYMNVSSQTDLYHKVEEKQEVQKYRINSNLGNTVIWSSDHPRMSHVPLIL